MNGAYGIDDYDLSCKLSMDNNRAEWWWYVRQSLDPGFGQDLALPPEHENAAYLASARWELTPRGIKVEDKDEIMERLGRSPDSGEAVIYGYGKAGTRARVRSL
jgi:hypothetical protein